MKQRLLATDSKPAPKTTQVVEHQLRLLVHYVLIGICISKAKCCKSNSKTTCKTSCKRKAKSAPQAQTQTPEPLQLISENVPGSVPTKTKKIKYEEAARMELLTATEAENPWDPENTSNQSIDWRILSIEGTAWEAVARSFQLYLTKT